MSNSTHLYIPKIERQERDRAENERRRLRAIEVQESSGSASHASNHITGGGDEIDGDKLDIDWNPTNYTPSTTPSEASSVDNLTAHLYGIDQKLAYSLTGQNMVAPWYDYPLTDATNGSHFNDNDSSYPAGWTEVDASANTTTNLYYGFWRLNSTGSDQTWKYRKQLSYSIESLANNTWTSLNWGPVLYRDTGNSNDETAYFGLYADDSGAPDEDVFTRVALNWDASAGIWQVRGETKDGVTQTNGSWFPLSENPQMPGIFLRAATLHTTAGTGEAVRAYVGSNPIPLTHTVLTQPTQNTTWGQPWMQVSYTRGGGGLTSILFIGGVDVTNDS